MEESLLHWDDACRPAPQKLACERLLEPANHLVLRIAPMARWRANYSLVPPSEQAHSAGKELSESWWDSVDLPAPGLEPNMMRWGRR